MKQEYLTRQFAGGYPHLNGSLQVYHKTKWVWLVFFTIISTNIIYLSVNQPITRASVSDIKKISLTYPKLFVTKVPDKYDVVKGDTIVITVTIENFGNKTAYNVTFIDQLNQPWIFEVSGLTQLSYGQIGVNETRQFSYSVTAKSLGTHTLHSAKIEYYDSDIHPTIYQTFSNYVEITVIERPEDFSLANLNSAITLFIVFVILDILLILRLIAPKFNRRQRS